MNAVTPSKYFEIGKFSHHFVLSNMSPSGQQIAARFARNYIQYGMVKTGRFLKRGAVKVFAAKIARKNEIRFHVGQYEAFKAYLADVGIPAVCYTEQTYGYVKASPLNCEITNEKTPFDYQIIINEYLQSPLPSRRKFVGISPGKGKTFTACWAASIYNTRIVGFLKTKYLKKWPGDLKELLGMSDEDIITVEGSAELMAVISAAKEDRLTAKAILVSSRTFQNYINEYEDKGDSILDTGYDCLPHEFCQVIQAGTRIVDEVHEEFHCNFKIDLYTHIEKAISLSATLESDDQFITKMMEVGYPPEERCQLVIRDKYVESYALRYNIMDGTNLRTTEMGSPNYSHMAFEKNFFGNRHGWLLNAYLDLIDYRFAERWLTRYEPGQKCLIYAASIQMCTTVTEYLKRKYPELRISRYVEKDPYDNLMKSDVCVSTIGSAGTGHDIKGLITVILTQAINAKAANIQGFGRLRKIEGVDVEFEYFTCKDVDKHMEYFMKKEMLLAERAKNCTTIDLPYTVGERH
jgi:hypothetical protein